MSLSVTFKRNSKSLDQTELPNKEKEKSPPPSIAKKIGELGQPSPTTVSERTYKIETYTPATFSTGTAISSDPTRFDSSKVKAKSADLTPDTVVQHKKKYVERLIKEIEDCDKMGADKLNLGENAEAVYDYLTNILHAMCEFSLRKTAHD